MHAGGPDRTVAAASAAHRPVAPLARVSEGDIADPDQCRRAGGAARPGTHSVARGVRQGLSLVAAGSPPLRRVYVGLPWPHLDQLPQSVASIIVERDWQHDGDRDEKALFLGRLKAPTPPPCPTWRPEC